MKTKLILTRLGSHFGKLRFDENSFYYVLLGFTPCWNNKPTNVVHSDSPGVYTSDKTLKISTLDKIHLKCDVKDGSVTNGSRQPIFCSFVIDKAAGYTDFSQPETVHDKKNKSVFNTISFYLEDDNHEKVDFNHKTFTFALQMIKT